MRAVSTPALRLGLVTLVAAVVAGIFGAAPASAASRDAASTATGAAGTTVLVAENASGAAVVAVAARPVTVTCGIATCSIYFSRARTRQMVTRSGAIAILTGACGHPICRVLAVSAGLVALKADEAAGKNQCLRVRFTHSVPPVVVGLYSDSSRYCTNT